MKKVRRYTEEEEREIDQMCYRSKRGRGTMKDASRALVLHKINPTEYGEIQRAAASRAIEDEKALCQL